MVRQSLPSSRVATLAHGRFLVSLTSVLNPDDPVAKTRGGGGTLIQTQTWVNLLLTAPPYGPHRWELSRFQARMTWLKYDTWGTSDNSRGPLGPAWGSIS